MLYRARTRICGFQVSWEAWKDTSEGKEAWSGKGLRDGAGEHFGGHFGYGLLECVTVESRLAFLSRQYNSHCFEGGKIEKLFCLFCFWVTLSQLVSGNPLDFMYTCFFFLGWLSRGCSPYPRSPASWYSCPLTSPHKHRQKVRLASNQ